MSASSLATSPSKLSQGSNSTSGGLSSLAWEQSPWSCSSSESLSSHNPQWLIIEVSSAFSRGFFISFPKVFINVGTTLATSPSTPSPSYTST
ncbi:hypothetical protein NL676_034319 [Syzygium grande]|nr:hypothetical protein NL676_034319 [Syzygium grande]